MEIIALQEYTDKYVSLYEGEIRNIPDIIAYKLIDQNIVAKHKGGIADIVFYVSVDAETGAVRIDTTFDNIKQVYESGGSVFAEYIYNGQMGASQYALMPLSGYIANNDTGEISQFTFSFTTITGGNYPRMIWLEVGKTYASLYDKQMNPLN